MCLRPLCMHVSNAQCRAQCVPGSCSSPRPRPSTTTALRGSAKRCSDVTCGGASHCIDQQDGFECFCAKGWIGGGRNKLCQSVSLPAPAPHREQTSNHHLDPCSLRGRHERVCRGDVWRLAIPMRGWHQHVRVLVCRGLLWWRDQRRVQRCERWHSH